MPRLSRSRAAAAFAPPSASARSRRRAEKTERQHHVVDHRAVGKQIEHLEDDAQMFRPEAVARRTSKPCDIGPQHIDCASLRGDDARKQAQEGGLAAARRADQQEPLALMQGEAVYGEREGVPARPGENHVRHLDDGRGERAWLCGSCAA